jgi:hypothetical protein
VPQRLNPTKSQTGRDASQNLRNLTRRASALTSRTQHAPPREPPSGQALAKVEIRFGKDPVAVHFAPHPTSPGSNTFSAAQIRRRLLAKTLHLVAIPSPSASSPPPNQSESAPWDPFFEGRVHLEIIKNAEGGALNRTNAANRLGITIQALHQRAVGRRLVAWTDQVGRYHYPRWQFGLNGLLPGVQECLEELNGSDQWAVMRFFLTEAESAGNVSPLTLLRQGKTQPAIQLARSQSIHA